MFLALNLILTKKQKFDKHINGRSKKINIKNRTYYLYNDQIDLKDFDARSLKVDKKYYNETDIYCIGYVTIKKTGDYDNINSVNLLYLIINELIGHVEK